MSSTRHPILLVANAATADPQLHRAVESLVADPGARVRVVAARARLGLPTVRVAVDVSARDAEPAPIAA